MDSSRLGRLQRAVLDHFFAAAPDVWFLTGGAALAGFWLGHRTTSDLDLFASDGDLASGVRALRLAADDLGATVTPLVQSVDFARFLVQSDDAVVVDLVRDRVPALYPKAVRDGVRLDPPEEIAANKVATLV